jgi:hypothetical protein
MGKAAWIRRVLADDALTRGLADPEARILMDWLGEQIERLPMLPEADLAAAVTSLCRHARRMRSFVVMWCHEFNHEGAIQLAAVEGFSDRLPTTQMLHPCDVMEHLLLPLGASIQAWRTAA